MTDSVRFAPGWPGIPGRWTSSAKSGVGTAPTRASLVWFTLSHGIFNEIYYPDVDWACTRDMGLIVTDGAEFFSEEKRHTRSESSPLARGVPGFHVRNTCVHGRYRVEKRIVTSVRHDAVLQDTRFIPLVGTLRDYQVHVLLSSHLANHGAGNTAWLGDYKGVPMLFAERDGSALALACSSPWLMRSVGFVGTSDGWQDLAQHKRMTWCWERAENGNVALTGHVDVHVADGAFLLVIGFGSDARKAGYHARAALLDGFERARHQFVHGWQQWRESLAPHEVGLPGDPDIVATSATVLRVHESKRFASATIASLSVPWGFSKGDDDLGGYHLVWPRDLVESAGGLLAVGAVRDALHVLDYLAVTQSRDGHWAQNMWLDGEPYWRGIQLDETAFPILLVDLLHREGALGREDLSHVWAMVRAAAGFIVRNGPSTPQDRWEEDAGFSPFTLAAEISALLVAANVAEHVGDAIAAAYLRDTADAWNDDIERWTYATDTPLARQIGVEGYYVRIAPETPDGGDERPEGAAPIKVGPADLDGAASQVVSPDALALVRFGLRAPDDPRIRNTVRAIDALLQRKLPYGPGWRRYNGDVYGEYDDGRPYDGGGVGRCWPLLTGERAHYEMMAGNLDRARELLRVMEHATDGNRLFPEQVWDGPAIPNLELIPGMPAGSAMPLVWAHAEYLKLCRSLADGRVFDTPSHAAQRYVFQRTESRVAAWRFNLKRRGMPAGRTLRLEVLAPAVVRWSADGWSTFHDVPTADTGLGVHIADLPTDALPAGAAVEFTFEWPDAARWEGRNFRVGVE